MVPEERLAKLVVLEFSWTIKGSIQEVKEKGADVLSFNI
jgi:hypothetical protein